jgi:hypothetical protein
MYSAEDFYSNLACDQSMGYIYIIKTSSLVNWRAVKLRQRYRRDFLIQKDIYRIRPLSQSNPCRCLRWINKIKENANEPHRLTLMISADHMIRREESIEKRKEIRSTNHFQGKNRVSLAVKCYVCVLLWNWDEAVASKMMPLDLVFKTSQITLAVGAGLYSRVSVRL